MCDIQLSPTILEVRFYPSWKICLYEGLPTNCSALISVYYVKLPPSPTQYVESEPGDFVTLSGKVVGRHEGGFKIMCLHLSTVWCQATIYILLVSVPGWEVIASRTV